MDTYRVGHEVFSFVATSLNTPLRARKLKEQDSISISLANIQRIEQDAHIKDTVHHHISLCFNSLRQGSQNKAGTGQNDRLQ